MRTPRFVISLVNHPQDSEASHWEKDVSVRETRAIKKAQALSIKNGNIILWKILSEGQLQRISFRNRSPRLRSREAVT